MPSNSSTDKSEKKLSKEDIDKQRKAEAASLLALRVAVNHTQQEAADFLYVPKRTYQNWEYGESRIPKASLELYKLKAIKNGLLPDDFEG